MSARDTARALLSGLAGADGLDEVAARLASLEVAVAENAALQVPLERLVEDLERAVAGVVERSAADGVGA